MEVSFFSFGLGDYQLLQHQLLPGHWLSEVDDECKLHTFMRRIWTQKLLLILVAEWKDCVIQISDENSKQGFSIKQAVWTTAVPVCH